MGKLKSGQKITPFLWFDNQAGEAAKLYTAVFNRSKKSVGKNKIKDTPSGNVQVYTVDLFGQRFTLMNAGPMFKFTEAISFVIDCKDQKEVDYYWKALTAKGGEPGRCGWLKDRFGVSWQVVPQKLGEYLSKDKSGRVMQEMLKMNKLIIKDLEKAFKSKLNEK